MILAWSAVLLIPAVFYGTFLPEKNGMTVAAILLASAVVSGILYLMTGAGVRCPLCHGPVLGRPGCSRNQKATRLLGSYRLDVALKVLLLGRFRCPCCGEPCKCQTSPR